MGGGASKPEVMYNEAHLAHLRAQLSALEPRNEYEVSTGAAESRRSALKSEIYDLTRYEREAEGRRMAAAAEQKRRENLPEPTYGKKESDRTKEDAERLWRTLSKKKRDELITTKQEFLGKFEGDRNWDHLSGQNQICQLRNEISTYPRIWRELDESETERRQRAEAEALKIRRARETRIANHQ